MSKVIIKQTELPIPLSDHINKFQFRVVNENRNIFSDWSIVNFIKQETLLTLDNDTLPPPTNPDDVLVILPVPDQALSGWASGWTPISDILPTDIVYDANNYDIPMGGNKDDVLTKLSEDDYDVDWLPAASIVDPQNVNLVVGISMFS